MRPLADITKQHEVIDGRDFVKVNALSEAFWMEVLHREGDDVIGRIDNHLFCTDVHGYSVDEVIRCRPATRYGNTVLEPVTHECV